MTLGVGKCKAGARECAANGQGFGPCNGQVLPAPEDCATLDDDDCDGAANEASAGCVCFPGATQPCYGGPAGTQGVGACQSGVITCVASGHGFGACVGEVLPHAETCATPIDEDCRLGPDCGDLVWAKSFGASGQQQIFGVARAANDGSLITGSFTGSFTIGNTTLTSAGGTDIFVAYLGPDGSPQWAKRFGGAGQSEQGSQIASDSFGNVYVTGYFDGPLDFGGGVLSPAGDLDAFVVKLDFAGNHLWSKRFGDVGPQVGVDIAVGLMGDVAVLAKGQNGMDFGGGVLTSAGLFDLFVAKLDTNGNHLWSKRFGGAADEDAAAIGMDGLGRVALAGSLTGTIDFGGGQLTSMGGTDIVVAALDGNGDHLWSKRFGDGGDQAPTDLDVSLGGSVYVTGGFGGSVDFGEGPLTAVSASDMFLVQLWMFNGAAFHNKRWGVAGTTISPAAVTSGPEGDVFVAGSVTGPIDLGGGALPAGGLADAFALRLNLAFEYEWSRRFGADQSQHARALATQAYGDLLVGGYFEGTMAMDAYGLSSAGGFDAWVARIGP